MGSIAKSFCRIGSYADHSFLFLTLLFLPRHPPPLPFSPSPSFPFLAFVISLLFSIPPFCFLPSVLLDNLTMLYPYSHSR